MSVDQRGRRGFSLLELLVAMTLGALVTVAVVRLFASSGRLSGDLLGQARLQESARMAFGFIGRSVRAAGYLGCGARQPINGLNGAWASIPEFDISRPVAGADGGSARAWTPPLTALPLRRGRGAPVFDRGGIDADRLRGGSDILILRRVEPLLPLLRPIRAAGDPVVVADPNGVLRPDAFAVFGDCGRATLFRITSVARTGGAASLARAPGSGAFGNRADARLFDGAPYGDASGPAGAGVGLVVSEFIFVARAAGADRRGRPVWSLWRKTSAERPRELVRGIDDLQILLAVDSTPDNADRSPNQWVPPSAVGAGAVRGVRLTVTASAVDGVAARPPATRAFAATFAVRGS